MRKTILILCCAISSQFIVAQRSTYFTSQNRLFHEGKSMFEEKNYAGCIDKITQYQRQSNNTLDNRDLLLESDFLLLAADFYQGKEVLLELKDFLEQQPSSIHCNEVYFMIGSAHFAKSEYPQAVFWLNQSQIEYLSEKQQEEFAYRMAYSCLKTDKKAEAFRLFSLLKTNSSKYKDAANYYLGYLYYAENDYDSALKLFNQVRHKFEFQPEVLYYITQINFIKRNYSETISEGKKLLESYPNNNHNAEINRIVGLSHYYTNNYQETIPYLSNAVTSGDNIDSKDYYILGLAYFMQKNDEKAVENFSLSMPGNNELGQSTYLYLGQAYLNLGDSPNALMAFESASRMNFDAQAQEAATYNYAMLLHQNSVSAFGESVTVLENFLNTYPQSSYSEKVNDALVEVYLTTKNYDTALASIAKIKNPGSKIQQAKQQIYFHLGTVDFTNTNYDSAIDNFSKAISVGNYAPSEKAQAIYWRGESHYKKGNYTQATQDFRAFLQAETNTSEALKNRANYNLGYCAFKQKQYSEAEKHFTTFIQKDKEKSNDLADAYARLGDCYFQNRQFKDAENAYTQAIQAQPSIAGYAIYQKGYVLGLQKDYKGKIAQMDQLIKNYPQSPYITDAIYEKGRAYVLLENNKAAIDTYLGLLNKYPNSNWARKAGLQIGLLYFNDNQPQKAASAYKKVIADYPGSEEAKVAIQDLKSVYFDMNDVSGYATYVNSLGGAVKFNISEQDSLTYLAAERFFNRGDIAQAQSSMNNYLQSFPDGAFNVHAHYYLANTYYQQNKWVQAKQEYGKVLDAGSTQFTEEAVARTAELQYNDKEYEAALLSYERLQKIADSRSNKEIAFLGVIRSAAQLKKNNTIITAAHTLLEDEILNPEIETEVRYHRAKAYLALNETQLASHDFQELAKDTRTVYGAEAKFQLATLYFNQGNSAKAKSVIQEYIQQGTPHSYWLAKSFILLSDIFASEKDFLQSKQYLESLQANYKNNDDDIHTLIKERLSQF